MRHYTYILAATILLSGCSTVPSIGISAYTMDARYQRQCVGPTAPFRPTDRECRQMFEPHTQYNQVHRVPRREELEPWQRDILQRQECRATGKNCPEGLK